MPATVDIIPVVTFTNRILALSESAIKILPDASIATPLGLFTLDTVASLPSPLYGAVPMPATVLIIPVTVSNFRMRWPNVSAMKISPRVSTAIP